MLIAAATAKDGRNILIIGLQDENVRRLCNDEPIYRALHEVPGLEEWDVSVLGPEDTARFIAAASA